MSERAKFVAKYILDKAARGEEYQSDWMRQADFAYEELLKLKEDSEYELVPFNLEVFLRDRPELRTRDGREASLTRVNCGDCSWPLVGEVKVTESCLMAFASWTLGGAYHVSCIESNLDLFMRIKKSKPVETKLIPFDLNMWLNDKSLEVYTRDDKRAFIHYFSEVHDKCPAEECICGFVIDEDKNFHSYGAWYKNGFYHIDSSPNDWDLFLKVVAK